LVGRGQGIGRSAGGGFGIEKRSVRVYRQDENKKEAWMDGNGGSKGGAEEGQGQR
jgi:hypothetical protein